MISTYYDRYGQLRSSPQPFTPAAGVASFTTTSSTWTGIMTWAVYLLHVLHATQTVLMCFVFCHALYCLIALQSYYVGLDFCTSWNHRILLKPMFIGWWYNWYKSSKTPWQKHLTSTDKCFTNAMTCATSCLIFSDLTFICTSSREQIYANHEVRQITRELHQDRLNDVARWTVERSFFSFLNSLLHVDSNVPCGKSCRSRCQFRWLIVIPDRETQEACGVFRGSCRWQYFPRWWQRQELAFHPGWYTIMTNDCHLCWHPFAMES